MKELSLSVFLSWAIANILKPLITWIKEKKLSKETIFTNGGMPSGHTALVASLVVALFLETGFSEVFFVALVLAIIVIYDATNVRTVIEKQSLAINALTREIKNIAKLEENVGHTLAEVLVSLGISIIIPIFVYSIF